MLAKDGVPDRADIQAIMPAAERLKVGPVAIIECFQEIPCNPCADACPRGAIHMQGGISSRPVLDWNRCNGCGLCVGICPGLAICVVDASLSLNQALVKLPYEFLPLPAPGQVVDALDRCGDKVCDGRVERVQQLGNKTTLVSLVVPQEQSMSVRNIRMGEGEGW